LTKDGLLKGLAKTAWRLARCHPFCNGGYDPP
jgi:putative component of membrane protein insertase Oxa1/YidC/SpoIIIJ protein YidD